MREFRTSRNGALGLAAVLGLAVALGGCAKKEEGSDYTPPATWTISGTVTSGGTGLAGVRVRIVGQAGYVTTDALGRYALEGLVDGSYVVEPSLAGYSFTPPNLTVPVAGANVTGRDFVAAVGIAITGTVSGEAGEGVTITLTGPLPATTTQTTTTDADGNYAFDGIAAGDYTITPSLAGGYTFFPANCRVTVGTTSLTGPDFTGIAPVHAISGQVSGAVSAGVVVTLSGGAGAIAVTDGSGNYSFTGLPPGDYTVTPAAGGYAFTPGSLDVTLGAADVTGRNFVAAATYAIAGRVAGAVLEGVKVTLSGDGSGDATTDASGFYVLTGLANGDYVVTPSLAGYTFAPAEASVTISGADATVATFTATSQATYAVTGSISGAIQAGVTVTLQGTTTAVTTTGVGGTFRFDGVAPGDYLLIPTHDDYLFTEASRLVAVRTADVTGQTFTSALNPTARTISGVVSGVVTSGVTVTLVGPAPATTSRTATTDGRGAFAFRNLVNGVYTATPSQAGASFTPANCLVTVSGPSVTSLQFLSTASISGTITGAVVAGVTVELSGAATATAVTDGSGNYTFTGLGNGEYTVTPKLPGYAFGPASVAVSLAGGGATGVNFVSVATHVISGFVTGDVLEGVKLTLAGPVAGEVDSDVTGYFEFPELPAGNYVVTAALEGYAFAPYSVAVTLAGADYGAADFVATLVPVYTVSGTIAGAVVADVDVTITDGVTSDTVKTDGGGLYTFTGLENGSYMVIPAAAGYAFTPAARAFRVDGGDVFNQDFTSAAAP
jgi:hypothetical protein